MSQANPMVLTVGHSNHSPEVFIGLLIRHGVDEIIDVRSAPYSRYAPQFNYEGLCRMLEDIGIGYTYLGGELGGRPVDRSCYDPDGRVLYDRVAATDAFDDSLRRVTRVADENRVALLCTEKEPLECHRTLLVARALTNGHVDVAHIQADGSLESHDDAMSRLLELHKLPPHGDMFRTRSDVITEALDRQARKFAYVATELASASANWESGP